MTFRKILLGAVLAGGLLATMLPGQIYRTRIYSRPDVPANNRSVYVIANVEAFGLDRDSGNKKWEYSLRNSPSASPIADAQQVYVPTVDTHFSAFYLPFVGVGGMRDGEEGVSRVY